MVKNSAIAIMLLGAGIAQASAWTPGDGLMAIAAGQNGLGELQEVGGFLSGDPSLFVKGVSNQVGAGYAEAAGDFLHGVAGKRRALKSDISEDFQNLGQELRTTGQQLGEDLKDAGEKIGQSFQDGWNTLTQDLQNPEFDSSPNNEYDLPNNEYYEDEPIEINSNRNLLWQPGDGLMALAAGQNALGEWQEGAGILTANPNLWKNGIANQVGSGFTEAAGNYIHAVTGRRLFSVSDAVDSIVEMLDR